MKYLMNLVAVVLFTVQVALANNYSYIYIEGDKQTPFYVKMEGQMMPRLGKNYCIVPNLAAGVTNIEILFQQNAYPVQKFAINIPEAGSRGFVLQKVNDRQFALYDIQQGFYIVSGNKPEEDKMPSVHQQSGIAADNTPAAVSSGNEDIPAFQPEKKQQKVKSTEEAGAATGGEDGRFISGIELNTNGAEQAAVKPAEEALPDFNAANTSAKKKKKAKKNKNADTLTNLAAISDEGETEVKIAEPATEEEAVNERGNVPNTDCKAAMSSEEFESFALKILDKADDDARLKVLTKSKGKHCFTTEQVRIIANNLDTQSGRYEVVKMLYAQTSDQGNYPRLESLFKTNYLREKFKEIINPK